MNEDILLAARTLCVLRFSVDVPEDDPDFTRFVAIDSATDTLPLGPVRSRWSPGALLQKDAAIARCRKWAENSGRMAAEHIVRKFEGVG